MKIGKDVVAKMSLHRAFVVLSIITWCLYVNADGPRQVNCEVYVYHPNCRGMQAKKRFMNTVDEKTDPACPCRNVKRAHHTDADPLASSKLLEALLAKGFDVDTIYDAYAATADRRRNYNLNRDRSSQRRKSLADSATDFINSDMDEDYQ